MISKRAAQRAALLFCLFSLASFFSLFILAKTNCFADAGPSLQRLEILTSQGPRSFEIEIATTPEEQGRGLMFRKELPADKGMLFIHKAPKEVSMWMRNTYIPLDMIFINEHGTIHRIEKGTEPLSEDIISSKGPVLGVLEVLAGTSERLGLKVGDQIKHPLFKTP